MVALKVRARVHLASVLVLVAQRAVQKRQQRPRKPLKQVVNNYRLELFEERPDQIMDAWNQSHFSIWYTQYGFHVMAGSGGHSWIDCFTLAFRAISTFTEQLSLKQHENPKLW